MFLHLEEEKNSSDLLIEWRVISKYVSISYSTGFIIVLKKTQWVFSLI